MDGGDNSWCGKILAALDVIVSEISVADGWCCFEEF
jgi:hypothetical protein